MKYVFRFGRAVLAKRPERWGLSILFGALIGVAAGRTLIGTVAGTVSVVEGTSMSPTYGPGARVYTVPITSPLERGDIVLIQDDEDGCVLKRIIGMPGEKVTIWRGYVFINGRMIREPYLPRYTFTAPDERTGATVFQPAQNEYFVLGDNRAWSLDSRRYGSVRRDRILSRVPGSERECGVTFAPYTLPGQGKRTIRPAFTQAETREPVSVEIAPQLRSRNANISSGSPSELTSPSSSQKVTPRSEPI